MSQSPLLLGHRGARSISGVAENTLAAFDLALSSGCDGFEFDVRLSADGVAVVAHDPMIGEVEIAQTPVADLPALPGLEAVIEKFGGRAFLDIELKVAGSGAVAVAALHKYLPQHCVISSFLPEVLQEVRNLDDSIALGFICDDNGKLPQWRGLDCDYVIAHQGLVSETLIAELHASDRKVLAWTVNRAAAMLDLAQTGVDGIISDDPALLIRTLRPAREV